MCKDNRVISQCLNKILMSFSFITVLHALTLYTNIDELNKQVNKIKISIPWTRLQIAEGTNLDDVIHIEQLL